MTPTRFAAVIIFAALVFLGSRIFPNINLFRDLPEIFYGECEILRGPLGPEDITIDHDLERAYIGGDDRRPYIRDGSFDFAQPGTIWSLDLKNPDSQAVLMQHDLEGPFHPHGIDLLHQTNELYVVNHTSIYEHEIDVFEIVSATELKLLRRIQFPQMHAPNDIAVLAQNRFFVTNDHANPRGTLLEKLEVYSTYPGASVAYFDGENGSIVIDGLRVANGIAISESGKELYVAESTRSTVTRYVREDTNTPWRKDERINLNSAVDNLEWTQEGTLLTGAHPKPIDFLAHTSEATNPSPSEVIEISVTQSPMQAKTILVDDGQKLSGSSAAARHNGTLLVGVVFEEQLTRCR